MDSERNDILTQAIQRLEYFGRMGVKLVPFSVPVSEGEKKLSAIRAKVKGCERCAMPLRKANAVTGEGGQSASVVFVVGAPKVAAPSGGALMQSRDMELLKNIIKAICLEQIKRYLLFTGGN